MKKRNRRKIVLILMLSLAAANYYVEYGKKVKASETEQIVTEVGEDAVRQLAKSAEETESENGMETETEVESERESESESETEGEKKAETEAESGNAEERETAEGKETESEKMSEPEGKTETERGTEEAKETEAESEMEGETESARAEGKETESEKMSEPEGKTESESETEREEQTEAEGAAESESETTSKTENETETETAETKETESETDAESETAGEKETETESESEVQRKVIRVSAAAPLLSEQGRIYDGTDQIELTYEAEGWGEEEDVTVRCQAQLGGSEVGEWPVEYRFWLEGEAAEAYELQVEETPMTVTILPKPLTVQLPDGWKAYGKTAEMKNIQLFGEIQVSGFVKDEKGNEVIPEEFELPQIGVDTSVVGTWSEIYEDGVQKVYENALVMRRAKDGTITGNATKNYVFSEAEDTGDYQKGSLVIAPSEILPGIDYEVKGEEGAWLFSEEGSLWIRQGSSLQILPRKDRGYTEGWKTDAVTESGILNFSLKKRNAKGELTAASLEQQIRVRTDGSVPQAVLNFSGVREEKGICYGNGDVCVQIQIPEDEESGNKSARYFLAVNRENVSGAVPESREWWQDCSSGMQIQLAEPGSYTLYTETQDQTGNKAYTKSPEIRIDRSAPILEIDGVKDQSANRGEVRLTVKCQDENYRPGSLKVKIQGANGTFVPVQLEEEESGQGASKRFGDFARSREADDIYTITVSAEDLAGNRAEKTVKFSVNRFGSVYDLSEETKQELKHYYHRQPFAVTFLETNLDYVGDVRILCKREGKVTELVENLEYRSFCLETKQGWKQYRYQIPAAAFEQEGSYEVLLLSKDQAENSSNSQVQEKQVSFAIDRSAPECLITGLEAGTIYQEKERWICLEPRDNICLKEMRIYLNGVQTALYSGEEIQKLGGLIKWKAEAKEAWQRIQIQVKDAAGNQLWTEELPFYLTEKEEIGEILPYQKKEKSARELAEFLLSPEMLKKKTGEYGMGEAVKQEAMETKQNERPVQQETKAKLQTAFLAAWDGKKGILGLTGSLGAVFLFLSAGIRSFRRKR